MPLKPKNSAKPSKSRKSTSTPARDKSKRAKPREISRWENEGGATAPEADAETATRQPAKQPVQKQTGNRGPEVPKSKKKSKDSAGTDDDRQQRVFAAAKRSRIERSGVESRTLGHVSSRGKRSQARRDSKN